jgi:hypothetical protein
LEIGGNSLFWSAVPEQTTFYWSSPKPSSHADRALGPFRLLRCLRGLRTGRYDLLIVHATQYAPWHPRSFLTALRSWHVRAPLGIFTLFAWRLVHLFHSVPIAVIDLGDSFGIGRHNFFLLTACRAFFKRELPSDHWQVFHKSGSRDFPGRRWRGKPKAQSLLKKLKPISYGMLAPVPLGIATQKTADIFFAGSLEPNSTVRQAGIAELRALQGEGYVIDIPAERLPTLAFLQRMSAAWIAWSPAGLGWDCARHYEAALVNTVPMMNYPSIMRDRPLQDGVHCILYAIEAGGLAQAARTALADKPRLQRMAQAASDHVQRHHSARGRAEHITVEVLRRRLDGTPVARATTD